MNAAPECLKRDGNAVLINLKVIPRSSRNEICGLQGDRLKIKVNAPPVDSAANEAVLRLLAETLKCSRSKLQLIKGAQARQKVVAVQGLTEAEVAQRLGL